MVGVELRAAVSIYLTEWAQAGVLLILSTSNIRVDALKKALKSSMYFEVYFMAKINLASHENTHLSQHPAVDELLHAVPSDGHLTTCTCNTTSYR